MEENINLCVFWRSVRNYRTSFPMGQFTCSAAETCFKTNDIENIELQLNALGWNKIFFSKQQCTTDYGKRINLQIYFLKRQSTVFSSFSVDKPLWVFPTWLYCAAKLCMRIMKWKMNGFANCIVPLHRSKYSFLSLSFSLYSRLCRDVGSYPTSQCHVFRENKHINNIETISKFVQIKPSVFVVFSHFFNCVAGRKRKKLFASFHTNKKGTFCYKRWKQQQTQGDSHKDLDNDRHWVVTESILVCFASHNSKHKKGDKTKTSNTNWRHNDTKGISMHSTVWAHTRTYTQRSHHIT